MAVAPLGTLAEVAWVLLAAAAWVVRSRRRDRAVTWLALAMTAAAARIIVQYVRSETVAEAMRRAGPEGLAGGVLEGLAPSDLAFLSVTILLVIAYWWGMALAAVSWARSGRGATGLVAVAAAATAAQVLVVALVTPGPAPLVTPALMYATSYAVVVLQAGLWGLLAAAAWRSHRDRPGLGLHWLALAAAAAGLGTLLGAGVTPLMPIPAWRGAAYGLLWARQVLVPVTPAALGALLWVQFRWRPAG